MPVIYDLKKPVKKPGDRAYILTQDDHATGSMAET
jgi:hypothetical protein